MSRWTAPCCVDCWNRNNPGRQTEHQTPGPDTFETCAWCGRQTDQGIYVKVDPLTVPFPPKEAP